MLTIEFKTFQSFFAPDIDIKDSKLREAVYTAVARQISVYCKEMGLTPNESKDVDISDDRHRIFYCRLVADPAFANMTILSSDPFEDTYNPKRWYERTKSLARRKGDSLFVLAAYYWFHLVEERKEYARFIDNAVFKKPFHVHFNLKRDQFFFPVEKRNQIKLKSIEITNDPDLANLPLPIDMPSSILVDGIPDISFALNWKYNLTDLYGRDSDLFELLDWAQSGNNEVKVRLLSGVGGSGKTRLAAEVAQKLEDFNWNAGFMGREKIECPTVYGDDKGVFIVIDYPEERMEFVENLINELWGMQEAYLPIRILLVSRLEADKWNDTRFKLKHRFSVQQSGSLKPLSVQDAIVMAKEAAEVLSKLIKQETPSLEGLNDWLQQDSSHRLPLFTLAVGIHAVLSDDRSFELSGQDLLLDIARIERERIRSFAKAHDKNEKWLERILALTIFSHDGFGQDVVCALGKVGATGNLDRQNLIDAVSKTPWQDIKDGDWQVSKLQPDRYAVAFLIVTLLEDGTIHLPEWIASVVQNDDIEIDSSISRILFDVSQFSIDHHTNLENIILSMIDFDPKLALKFQSITFREQSIFSAPLALKIIDTLVHAEKPNAADHAAYLANSANFLLKQGDPIKAIKYIEENISIRRRLAKTGSERDRANLALSLNNYANALGETSKWNDALKAMKEAIEIRRSLAKENPDEFLPNLASSLANLSNHFQNVELRVEALNVAVEAVNIYRALHKESPSTFDAELARSLHVLSGACSRQGEQKEALESIEEAVDIRRKLAEKFPDQFLPQLGFSLNNLVAIGRFEREKKINLQSAKEAIDLFETLSEIKPDVYVERLSTAYLNYSQNLADNGQPDKASTYSWKAIEYLETFYKKEPEIYALDFALALNSHTDRIIDIEGPESASNYLKKSHEILAEMMGRGETGIISDYARVKLLLGISLAAMNSKSAIKYISDSVDIYQKLYHKNPEVFEPQLQNALKTENGIRLLFGLDKRKPPRKSFLSGILTAFRRTEN